MTERRSTLRPSAFMQARVYFNEGRSSVDCIMRDFTEGGAKLRFPEVTVLPATFEVHVPSKGTYFEARAAWHRGNDIGVAWTRKRETPSSCGPTVHASSPRVA
jgi:PilZ domain